MTNVTLAHSYLIKSQKRLKILDLLLTEEAYSDVIREAIRDPVFLDQEGTRVPVPSRNSRSVRPEPVEG